MHTNHATIRFDATLYAINGRMILRLPLDASEKLPSRGQVAVNGMVNGYKLTTVLEPDGYWGHWMNVNETLQNSATLKAGDRVTATVRTTQVWPEPKVPHDFQKALDAAPQKVKDKWKDITSMARWEWLRWVNATKNPDTRALRIQKSVSKLNGKHRRPCCFNLAACTDPQLSKSGRLVDIQ